MPHLPKDMQFAPTNLPVMPEALPPRQSYKADMPVVESKRKEEEQNTAMIPTVSIMDHKVSADDVFKAMFGTTITESEMTGVANIGVLSAAARNTASAR